MQYPAIFIGVYFYIWFVICVALKVVQEENESLKGTITRLNQQLETALAAQESQRRVLETLAHQLGHRLSELGSIHREMLTAIQTWITFQHLYPFFS